MNHVNVPSCSSSALAQLLSILHLSPVSQPCETPWPWSEPTCWIWPSWALKGWLSQPWALEEHWTQTTHLSSSSLLSWSTASNMALEVRGRDCLKCSQVWVLCCCSCMSLTHVDVKAKYLSLAQNILRLCVCVWSLSSPISRLSPVKKSFLGFNKSLWGPLELVEKLCPEAVEVSASVRDLPGLK